MLNAYAVTPYAATVRFCESLEEENDIEVEYLAARTYDERHDPTNYRPAEFPHAWSL